MLIIDLLLSIVLLGLTGYLIYSTYKLYSTTTDEATKKDQKELRGYSVFVDMRLSRLCVSIWNGKESSAS